MNNNATCSGTKLQCCNSKTWKCGNPTKDCQEGTCYEGACLGASVYALDGRYGPNHRNLQYGGKWGDCCNFNGIYGTGPDFCSAGQCESGNYTLPIVVRNPGGGANASLPWEMGTTPDGSCGGQKGYTCGMLWGMCCGPKGTCGTDPDHCGDGCQKNFGTCNNRTDG